MAYEARNQGGPFEYVVDAEADLATITNPLVGQFALALAEGTIHYHTGSAWQAIGGAGGGAPTNADYLVGTANGSLSAEIVVGTSPGGELGGTWGSPTVDATHAGSAHHAQSHGNADHTSTFIIATDVTFENLDANADVGTGAAQVAQGSHTHAGGSGHTIQEDGVSATARTNLNFTTGIDVADDLANDQTDVSVDTSELVAGGELGGTLASATVDATHAGSAHHAQAHSGSDHTDPAAPVTQAFADVAAAGTGTLPPANEDHKHGMPANPVTAHEAAGDPHTGYRLESADHTHASTGLQAGTIDHGALTGLTDDDHTQYRKEADIVEHVTFTKTGTLTTGTGATRWYNDTGRTITLQSARGSVGTAPTGASILVDVNNNGTSVWNTTQANRITIAVSTNTDEGGAFDDTSIADGEYITVDIDQVGSTAAGADLTVTIWYTS